MRSLEFSLLKRESEEMRETWERERREVPSHTLLVCWLGSAVALDPFGMEEILDHV